MDESTADSNLFILNTIPMSNLDFNPMNATSGRHEFRTVLLGSQNCSNYELKALVNSSTDYQMIDVDDQPNESDTSDNCATETRPNTAIGSCTNSNEMKATISQIFTSTNRQATSITVEHSPTESSDKLALLSSTIKAPVCLSSSDVSGNADSTIDDSFRMDCKDANVKTNKEINGQTKRTLTNQMPHKYQLLNQQQPNQASRQTHNEKERKRRSRIKQSCELLRNLVPGGNQKTDKASLLEMTVDHLINLQNCLNKLNDVKEKRFKKEKFIL